MSFAKENFTITSDTFKDGEFLTNEQVYNGYGCTGKNISPELAWSNPPVGTKSYALVMHDPDAPVPGGWFHWIVANIPVSKTSFKKGELINSPAVLSKTSFNSTGYGGPCPPAGHGKHRYIFTVYALDKENLPISQELSPGKVEAMIQQRALAKTSITGYYQR